MDCDYPKFKEIAHTADLQIIAYGKSLEELFSNSGEGMYHVAGAVCGRKKEESKHIFLKGNDPETLLIGYLEELLRFIDHHLMTRSPRLNISLTDLSGEIPLYSLVGMKNEIKAVTYHEMEVTKEKGIFRTKITFDV
jgi:SHS2 domain-containing protein